MKASVIAATLLAAFSAGAFAQDREGKFPTGFPTGKRPTQVPGGAKSTGGFGNGFPGFGGAHPTQVPGAAHPSGGLGGAFPGFGHHSGFHTHTRKATADAAGLGAKAAETAKPSGHHKDKGKGKHHSKTRTGGTRPTQVPGSAQPSGGFGQRS